LNIQQKPNPHHHYLTWFILFHQAINKKNQL
jgi:hypothetical protein